MSTNLFKNRFKPTDTAAAGGGPKPGPKPNTKGPREPYVSLNPPGPTQVQLNRRRDSRGEPPGGGEGLPPRSGTPNSTASSELTVKMRKFGITVFGHHVPFVKDMSFTVALPPCFETLH